MLNSSVGDYGKVSVRRSAFSQTCALLSQFVREKKALGVSTEELRRTTMNLFPVIGENEEVPTSKDVESMSLFTQQASSTALKPDSSEIKSAPMTIFYAGQVIVFNDFPAEKAVEIMKLASLETPLVAFTGINNDSNSVHPITDSVLDLTALSPASICSDHQMQESAQNPIQTIFNGDYSNLLVPYLPMVRKASLQRFLGKRRERIAARAPYSTSKRGDFESESQPNETDSWLGLAAAAGDGAGLP